MAVQEGSGAASRRLEELDQLRACMCEEAIEREIEVSGDSIERLEKILKSYMDNIARRNELLQEALERTSDDLPNPSPISGANKKRSLSEGDLQNARDFRNYSNVLGAVEKIKVLLTTIQGSSIATPQCLEELDRLRGSLCKPAIDREIKILVKSIKKLKKTLKFHMENIARQNKLLQEALEITSGDLPNPSAISGANKKHSLSEGDLQNARDFRNYSNVLEAVEKIKALLESIRKLEENRGGL